jgi:hypothetical protein
MSMYKNLPAEMIIEIFSHLDNKSLLEASKASIGTRNVAWTVARDRYRRQYKINPPTDWLLRQVLSTLNPVSATYLLDEFINMRPAIDLTMPDDDVIDIPNQPIFVGHGTLRVQVDLDDMSDLNYPNANLIEFTVDMDNEHGILRIFKFLDIFYDAVFNGFIGPLYAGQQPQHGMEADYLNGVIFVYNSVERLENGTYLFDITD